MFFYSQFYVNKEQPNEKHYIFKKLEENFVLFSHILVLFLKFPMLSWNMESHSGR